MTFHRIARSGLTAVALLGFGGVVSAKEGPKPSPLYKEHPTAVAPSKATRLTGDGKSLSSKPAPGVQLTSSSLLVAADQRHMASVAVGDKPTSFANKPAKAPAASSNTRLTGGQASLTSAPVKSAILTPATPPNAVGSLSSLRR